MSEPLSATVVGDLSHLPRSMMGTRNIVWWGNLGFMLIEGMAFLLAAGCCLYLAGQVPDWPPAGTRPPDLLWGTVFTGLLLLSEIPALLLLRAARAHRETAVRYLALAMNLPGVLLVAVRLIEFAHLNVSWDDNAYGSVVWMLMLLHATHIITELGENGVQTVWLFTHVIGDDQFSDVEDNCNYWTFVVIAWLPIYFLVYWLPWLI